MATPVKIAANKNSVQRLKATDKCSEPPLIVIVGPTASGKSSLAMKVAKQFNGEIICADSRTIYKGMDIGTAKPTAQDQVEIPHWGIDLVEPGDRFTAADFKKYAQKAIASIRSRGKVPILVGGTGLYVDGVIFDFQFANPNPDLRAELETLTTSELINYCEKNNVTLPENQQNRRYLIRAIERKSASIKRLSEPIANTAIVGITTNKEDLRSRITIRANQLFSSGMIDEAVFLGKKYGWESEAMTGNIYKLVRKFIEGEFDEAELVQRFIVSDWQLAKRQLTWLRRNHFIHWASLDDAYIYIEGELTKGAQL